jgi:serine/threonine protein kinase
LRKRKIVIPENFLELKEDRQPSFKKGDYIGKLQVLEIIANKKYIDVYITLDEATGTTYVVKLLNETKISDKAKYNDELLCLEHEYSMLQRVRHIPSICCSYALVDNKPKGAYIVLEHIKGKPLSAFIRHSESLMPSACYTLIQNLLLAFASLHECNLIHGDIHPSNIMVEEDISIKIIDLGFSFDIAIESDELVKYGGVYFYMPPERINVSSQNKFSREPDFYSEVYQLGLIIYYVFYKQVPFTGFTWEELAGNIKTKEVVFPVLSCFNFPVPESILQIIKKCLHKKPNRRYATAAPLLKDFKQAILQIEVFTS